MPPHIDPHNTQVLIITDLTIALIMLIPSQTTHTTITHKLNHMAITLATMAPIKFTRPLPPQYHTTPHPPITIMHPHIINFLATMVTSTLAIMEEITIIIIAIKHQHLHIL